ncbi:unnamed protein product [marine sediment metagenome]|uniref:Uncharacterized protein n=1 Tax=marine sediment metagenome TaxID=412755 RepID=X0WHD2_9ZZZZ
MGEKERINIRVYLDDGSVKGQTVGSYPEAAVIVEESLTAGYADHSGRVTVYYPTHRIAKIKVEADIIIPPPPN